MQLLSFLAGRSGLLRNDIARAKDQALLFQPRSGLSGQLKMVGLSLVPSAHDNEEFCGFRTVH
jgi:hypothetical protein